MFYPPSSFVAQAVGPERFHPVGVILERITAPTAYPVTLPQVKAHLRIESDDDDAYLLQLIDNITAFLDGGDGVLGRCLVQQEWEMRFGQWQGDIGYGQWQRHIEIPLPPLVSVTSVNVLDATGTPQLVDPAQYVVIDRGWQPSIIQPASAWPSSGVYRQDAIRVRFLAGYVSVNIIDELQGAVPGNIVLAMLKAIANAYENRSPSAAVYWDATLLAPHALPIAS